MSKNDLTIKIRGGKSKIENISDAWGEIELYKSGIKIGESGFIINNYEISVDTITIEELFRREGYGKLIINIIKGLSRLYSKPIVLYSLKDSYGFYVAMGFVKLKNVRKKKNLVVIYKSKNEPKIEDLEMIWLPESVRGKKELRVEL